MVFVFRFLTEIFIIISFFNKKWPIFRVFARNWPFLFFFKLGISQEYNKIEVLDIYHFNKQIDNWQRTMIISRICLLLVANCTEF